MMEMTRKSLGSAVCAGSRRFYILLGLKITGIYPTASWGLIALWTISSGGLTKEAKAIDLGMVWPSKRASEKNASFVLLPTTTTYIINLSYLIYEKKSPTPYLFSMSSLKFFL
jgi:hypothetical protein